MTDDPCVRVPLSIFRIVLAAAITLVLSGCRTPAASGYLEPFSTVEPLRNGHTFLEVDPTAQREHGALIRVNEREWETEAVVTRGDRIEVAYRAAPRPGRLSYRALGVHPGGEIGFEASRWFDDGFPAQVRSVRVRPYHDGRP